MCLRFVFLLTTRAVSWLRLSRREETWKTAEILILRRQLAVLQRRQPRRPKLNWADRLLLVTLLSVIPKGRRHGLRLLVTPDTILRWHRDIARRRWAARSMRGKNGRPPTRQNIRAMVLRLVREKPRMGLRRIHGELADLGVKVAASTGLGLAQTFRPRPAQRAAVVWASAWVPGRHSGARTSPGSTISRPSKNRATSSRRRNVTCSACIWFWRRCASAIASASMSAAGCDSAR